MESISLQYLIWNPLFESEKPYQIIANVPEGCPTSNLSFKKHDAETISDVRGREHAFNLDDHGFSYRNHDLKITDFSPKVVENEYIPQMKKWITEHIDDVSHVYVFDWRLRSSDQDRTYEEPGTEVDLNDLGRYIKPVETVHVDQSPAGAIQRVKFHMGEQAPDFLQRRFRILNLWRPITHTIRDYPLAVCDGGSINDKDLICADHVRRYYVGESIFPLYNPGAQWYYINKQSKDEILVFKTYDSSPSVKAKCCPHVSFRHTHVPEDAPPRESIEIRALAFS